MANVLQIPVPAQNAALVWPARSDPSVNTILLINQDLNNTIYIGQQSSITANGQNTIPVPPNGSISVDPASPWYVIGAVQGILPLVMVPNGQANFRGVSQGEGALAIPSLRSPNYDPVNQIGWAIFQNGAAVFHSISVPPGSGGNTVFVQSTTPSANAANDIWVDTANNNQILTATAPGTGNWVAQQFGTDAIASGAITASLLAVGIIVAGIVDGTTISGAQFVAHGSNGEILVYQGAPATGNLIGSWSAMSGTDNPILNNFFQAGIWIYDNFGNATGLVPGGNAGASYLALAAGNGTPSSVPAGITALFANANGEIIVEDSGDGQTYAVQRKTKVLGTGTINNTFTTLVNFTVSNRVYRISARIFFTAGTTQTVGFNFNCSGASSNAGFDITVKRAAALFGATYTNVLNAQTGVTASLTSGNTYVAEIEGYVTFGTGGFNLQMITSTGTASLVGGYCELMPV